MTESSLPLIIILVRLFDDFPGEGRVAGTVSVVVRRLDVRVHVYKCDDGTMSAMIEPSIGKGKPPVLVPGITTKNAAERILPAVVAMRAPREPRARDLSQK